MTALIDLIEKARARHAELKYENALGDEWSECDCGSDCWPCPELEHLNAILEAARKEVSHD